MKKIRPYLATVLIIGALLLIKFLFFPVEKVKGAGAGKDGKKPSTPVTVFVIGKESLENKLYTSGTILAKREAELRLEASGRVIYLNLAEGKPVKEGTLLLKVNDTELQAQLDKIKAQLKLAVDAESRQNKLLQVEGSSQHEYDITLANLNSLKADSAYFQAQIAKTKLYAPFNGVLGISDISVGSYVSPTVALVKIQQTHPIEIDFSLPEKYSAFLQVGDIISFRTESLPTTFSGKVTIRDPQVDVASRSVRYRAEGNNPKGQLLPGTFTNVEITLKENSNGLFVPTEAIVPILKGKKVFTVKGGLAEEKIVQTGIRTDDYVQILSGLEVGDSVVVNGNFQLKKGGSVKINKPKTKS